jgi:glycerophosphoryl diester phosphodiesterase
LVRANSPLIDWLVARPIAHRGLHDNAANIVENTSSAVEAAIAAGYAIEVDLQIAADGEAVVHHDHELGRLTDGQGRIRELTFGELSLVRFKTCSDRIMSVGELCERVAGRTALVLELKSRFDGDTRLALRVVATLRTYAGPVAVMSFDPRQMEIMRRSAPWLPRGIVARSRGDTGSVRRWHYLAKLVSARPHFVAYAAKDLPATGPRLARTMLGMPILAWTVRRPQDWQRARRWADQMIFENFRP